MRRACINVCRQVQLLISQATSPENVCYSAALDGECAVPLCACQEVWEWSHTQALYTVAISLGGCAQGVCMRVARVGGRCAIVVGQ